MSKSDYDFIRTPLLSPRFYFGTPHHGFSVAGKASEEEAGQAAALRWSPQVEFEQA